MNQKWRFTIIDRNISLGIILIWLLGCSDLGAFEGLTGSIKKAQSLFNLGVQEKLDGCRAQS